MYMDIFNQSTNHLIDLISKYTYSSSRFVLLEDLPVAGQKVDMWVTLVQPSPQ